MNCNDLLKPLVRSCGVCMVALIVMTGCGGDDGPAAASINTPPAPATSLPPPSDAPVNSPPVISGTPGQSVEAGLQYTFSPVASDPDADTLAFSIQNLPSWAEFDTVTGRLTGRPGAQDVGTFDAIAITVSDGKASTALGSFAVVVAPAAGSDSGSATLSWMAPTENIDGTPITDLAGYEVHFGKNADALNQTVRLSNPSLSTYIVENLEAGTWFFAVSAVNQQGARSEPSNVATKTVS